MTPNQERLIYWIKERENIRLLKEQGVPAPWSDNAVMQETYFCNIDREDDKVTIWIRDNWRYWYAPEQYPLAMFVARVFNRPSTLQIIEQPNGDINDWIERTTPILRAVKDKGGQVWGGAYLVSTNGRSMDKLDHCMEMFGYLASVPNITAGCSTLAAAHIKCMAVYGMSSFLAAQVVADLKNSDGHPLYTAPDWYTFNAYGPGSLRGLSWFHGRDIRPKDYGLAIQEARVIIAPYLKNKILTKLCMQNLQNCFCEYDKFMRVTNKTGKSKRKYKRGR